MHSTAYLVYLVAEAHHACGLSTNGQLQGSALHIANSSDCHHREWFRSRRCIDAAWLARGIR